MHVTVDIRGGDEKGGCESVFAYLTYIDEKFSTYKSDSEISKINRGEIAPDAYSADMQEIFKCAAQTKKESNGYFDMCAPNGFCDPSGVVKGWAIWKASDILKQAGHDYFFIDAGGDIQARVPDELHEWRVGIRNPFKKEEVIKILRITTEGVATSGTYERGSHIYNPKSPEQPITDIVSLTVVGPNVYEADRFATAAFAMGRAGINFIEAMPGLEGYSIDAKGIATQTSHFQKYVIT